MLNIRYFCGSKTEISDMVGTCSRHRRLEKSTQNFGLKP